MVFTKEGEIVCFKLALCVMPGIIPTDLSKKNECVQPLNFTAASTLYRCLLLQSLKNIRALVQRGTVFPIVFAKKARNVHFKKLIALNVCPVILPSTNKKDCVQPWKITVASTFYHCLLLQSLKNILSGTVFFYWVCQKKGGNIHFKKLVAWNVIQTLFVCFYLNTKSTYNPLTSL